MGDAPQGVSPTAGRKGTGPQVPNPTATPARSALRRCRCRRRLRRSLRRSLRLHSILRVAHGNTGAHGSKHRQVVLAIAKGNRFAHVDARRSSVAATPRSLPPLAGIMSQNRSHQRVVSECDTASVTICSSAGSTNAPKLVDRRVEGVGQTAPRGRRFPRCCRPPPRARTGGSQTSSSPCMHSES